MLVAAVLAFAALIVSLMNRGVFNPVSITLILLALSSGLASLHLYGLYDFDSISMRIIVLGGISVLLGAMVTNAVHSRNSWRDSSISAIDDQICYGRLNIAVFVSLVMVIVGRWQQIRVLMSGGSLADVRSTYLGYGLNEASIDILDRILVGPVTTIALPVLILGLFRKRSNAWFVVLSTILVVIGQLTTGGRFLFLYGAVMILALLASAGRLHFRTAKARLVLVSLIGAIVWFTLARGNELLFETYTYLSVPVLLLSHWAEFAQSTGTQTFGASFAYGALTLVFRISEVLGTPIGTDISTAVALPQVNWVEALPGRHFNAFVTMFYYFYLDFRWIGVIVFGGFWGALAQWSFERMWRTGARGIIFGLLMLQVAIMSFVRWEFTNGSLVIAICMLPFFVLPGNGNSPTRADLQSESPRI